MQILEKTKQNKTKQNKKIKKTNKQTKKSMLHIHELKCFEKIFWKSS